MKKNNITLIFCLLLVIVIMQPISSELQTLQPVKINTCTNIRQTCNNCSYINITTVDSPNMTYTVNQPMTKSGTDYNYTFCNNTQLGVYTIHEVSDPNGVLYNPPPYTYEVTPTGYKANSSQMIMMSFIVGIIFLIGLLLFIFGMQVQNTTIKIFCLSLTVLLIVFLVGYISGMANITIGEFSDLLSGFTPLYILFISLLSVGGIGLILYIVVVALDSFKKKRGLRL